ncbi:MAG: hypothetical protein JWR06_2177, partial [Jatrophihabitans sp.]|nr:hypothetical protein [Jatrophihabitans sp.]
MVEPAVPSFPEALTGALASVPAAGNRRATP